MLLLGAWQGERISLRAVTQHPPSALETELAASILMAASTLRIITELMFSPPQFHRLPGAACSSSCAGGCQAGQVAQPSHVREVTTPRTVVHRPEHCNN